MILPTAYFGNIEYYHHLLSGEEVFIEACENFPKQTFRNRTTIMGGGGLLTLTVPVKHRSGVKIKTSEVEIDYATAWQRVHWNSIVSAYRNSPYFDHYEYLFEPIFATRFENLLHLNEECLKATLKVLKIKPDIKHTENYISDVGRYDDLRVTLSPKYKGENRKSDFKPYYQVFSDRMNFAENISILDLIFCEGAHSINFIK